MRTITLEVVTHQGHKGLAINGKTLERGCFRNDGSYYTVAESLSALKEIVVVELDERWPLDYMNAIGIDGTIAIRPGVCLVNNTQIKVRRTA